MKGVFHYTDTDRTFESKFRVPDFEAMDPIGVAADLLGSAVKADTRRRTLAGIQLPVSISGIRPLSLQIDGESQTNMNLADEMRQKKEEKPKTDVRKSEPRVEMSDEAREAFEQARQICVGGSEASCDEALDTFHLVRFGKSLLVEDSDDVSFTRIIEDRLRGNSEPETVDPQSRASSSEARDNSEVRFSEATRSTSDDDDEAVNEGNFHEDSADQENHEASTSTSKFSSVTLQPQARGKWQPLKGRQRRIALEWDRVRSERLPHKQQIRLAPRQTPNPSSYRKSHFTPPRAAPTEPFRNKIHDFLRRIT